MWILMHSPRGGSGARKGRRTAAPARRVARWLFLRALGGVLIWHDAGPRHGEPCLTDVPSAIPRFGESFIRRRQTNGS